MENDAKEIPGGRTARRRLRRYRRRHEPPAEKGHPWRGVVVLLGFLCLAVLSMVLMGTL